MRTLATLTLAAAVTLTGCTSTGSTPPRPAPSASAAPTLSAAATKHAKDACTAWPDVVENASGSTGDPAHRAAFEKYTQRFLDGITGTEQDPRYEALRRGAARWGAAMTQRSMERAKAASTAIEEACSAL